MRFTTLGALLAALLVSTSALAIEEDQVRGEVVSYDEGTRSLRVELTEVGEDLTMQVGATRAWEVPSDVPIEFEVDRRLYRSYVGYDAGDIREGDQVLLSIDPRDSRRVVTLRNERTSDTRARDRVVREGRLIGETEDQARMADARRQGQGSARSDRGRSQRTSLPDSASLLPAAGLGGLLAAAAAFATRRLRRRLASR